MLFHVDLSNKACIDSKLAADLNATYGRRFCLCGSDLLSPELLWELSQPLGNQWRTARPREPP